LAKRKNGEKSGSCAENCVSRKNQPIFKPAINLQNPTEVIFKKPDARLNGIGFFN
jgi:hypothetical protein